MRNKFIKIISVLVAVIIAFSLFCIPVSALQEIWFSCDKPVVTDNSGYVEVSCQQGNFVFVFYTYNDVSDPHFSVYTDDNGYLYFYAYDSNGVSIPCVSYYLTQDGKAFSTPYWEDELYSYFRTYSISCISGYNVDVSNVTANVPSNPYTFMYSSEVVINDNLKSIINILQSQFGVTTSIEYIIDLILNHSAYQSEAIGDILDELKQGNSDIIKNQDKNSNQIQQNQDENTDKVLNGDEDLDSSGVTDKIDGTIGGIDDATNNALGGKSEEDIQNEVGGALDTDNLDIDWTKANRMSTFYDRCLKAFGSEYSTLLLLSLILGLSAFLIGRRYG